MKTKLATQCFETRISRIKDGVVQPIQSLRNRPNNLGILFNFGKRAGKPKPFKHKDCQIED